LSEALKAPKDQLESRLEASLDELKLAKSKLAALSALSLQTRIPEWVAGAESVGSNSLATVDLGTLDSADDLRALASSLQKALGTEGVALVSAIVADKPALVVAVGELARQHGVKAGDLVKLASGILGGGGGGKDDLAQGGGTDVSKLEAAIEAIRGKLA
jgi:alanyl-tRNA synthetase